ncbi:MULTISPECIES: hypothetical protein [Actinotignum]|uniref:Uncharacterized protein n=1 Tax=Actinotignum timonense TaxID=1870995 RepID=A0AAW9HNM9_9ACTO|nr:MULTISPECIES: hypothetical protein [Actinotignum]MDE1559276.1 hypothetical protein [Actinotignum schaalii]MDE1663936.1 hypothetical protein [Actinotignum schaalii]MDK6373603.1 hypothetical protein [Actinotignum timonense]MDK6419395.1 hypothetical protein [Actinotignum timonense]MDK6591161.1 hypothetical protein [Actinotignum timonense]
MNRIDVFQIFGKLLLSTLWHRAYFCAYLSPERETAQSTKINNNIVPVFNLKYRRSIAAAEVKE